LKLKLVDPDPDEKGTVYKIHIENARNFIEGKYPEYTISPKEKLIVPGTYLVNMLVIDDNPTQPSGRNFSFKITVTPPKNKNDSNNNITIY
jgi:hypothetical protein